MSIDLKEVIIIGGSYAALLALKTLLAQQPSSSDSIPQLKITLIAPNDKAFFNIASPRLIVDEDLLIDKTFFSLKDHIEQLVASQGNKGHEVVFIKGRVVNSDFEANTITYEENSGEFERKELKYDNLIVASGTRSPSSVWKLDNVKDQDYTISAIEDLRKQVKEAKSIAIIGGGATGVETAGELGYANKAKESKDKKRVVLYTGSFGPLSGPLPKHVEQTSKKLKDLNVEIVNDQFVSKVKDGVALEGTGDEDRVEKFDLVIEAQRLIPNTEFIPASQLNEKKYIITDDYFRLPEHQNVICFGDVLAMGEQSSVDLTYAQKPVFAKTVAKEILSQDVKLVSYQKLSRQIILVPIGKDGGVGVLFGFSIPNFLVRLFKSRDFMIPKAKGILSLD